jgi:biotin carboxyl carrier protein
MPTRKLRVTVEGKAYDVTVEMRDDPLGAASGVRSAPIVAPQRAPAPAARLPQGGGPDAYAPLTGQIVAVKVAVGDAVQAGQPVLVLEAMKMNTTIVAPRAGTVAAVHCQVGDMVEEGKILLTVG